MVIELGERSDDFTVRYVSITNERVFELYVRITSQKLWSKLYLSPVLKIDKDLYKEPFDHWMRQCIWVDKNCCKQTSDSIIANAVLSLFMVMEDVVNKNEEDVAVIGYSSQWKLLGDFLALLSRHYMTRHNVSFYAESLSITSDYLSVLMKECMGKTPKEIIDEKLVLAMKALLKSTTLSIKNIADRLHYEDSSHLCKVFRRHTGMSPAQYRKSLSE
ncbi:MAG: AraC family transcriptional regulator [Rikenellaceae bacterium]|nr:AraC family transcriptional regulator [Rikenellaceae bacterium]